MTKCTIIKDLFTAYVAGLASEDTRAFVDEHIATCEDCRKKLTEMQNRVVAHLSEKDAKSVNVFKTMKKKIFKRNVLVGVGASIVVAFIALFVGAGIIDYKPIPYYDGLVKVSVNYAGYYKDKNNMSLSVGDDISISITDPSQNPEGGGKTPVLDLQCTQNFYSTNAVGRTIVRNGEVVRVEYFCFLENFLSKKNTVKNAEQIMLRMVNAIYFGDDPIKMEVYYFTDIESARNNALSDQEFDDFRHKGNLLWSGTLE